MALKVHDLPTPESNTTRRRKAGRPASTYTVAEWLALPDERPYTELIDGVLRRMTAGTHNHSQIIFNLRLALATYLAQRGAGTVSAEVNVLVEGVTGRNGWIPDVVFAARDNPLQIGRDWVGVPDWVAEVWTGQEKRPQRIVEKRLRWQRAGVPELWEIISRPGQRTVNIYRLDKQGGYRQIPVEGDQYCSEVISGFCIERAAIFANLVEEQ